MTKTSTRARTLSAFIPVVPLLVVGLTGPGVLGQPATFGELGTLVVPASPAGASDSAVLPPNFFDFGGAGQGELLGVKWARFTLSQDIAAPLYLDIEAGLRTLAAPPATLTVALYNASGSLVRSAAQGTLVASGTDPAFSFGSSVPRSEPLSGQDGPLAAGTYYVALLAGSAPDASATDAGFAVSTTQALRLGLFQPNTYFVTLDLSFGNTETVVPPANDNCDGALPVGLDVGTTPAWTGSNDNATPSASFPCVVPQGVPPVKEVWFSFTPASSGQVAVTALPAPNSGSLPVVAALSACGTEPIACAVREPAPGRDVQFILSTTAGQPVLIALGGFGGTTGDFALSIRPVVEACNPSDVASAGPTVGPDGEMTSDDLILFVNWFVASDARADIASTGPVEGADGEFTADDVILFVSRFTAGC